MHGSWGRLLHLASFMKVQLSPLQSLVSIIVSLSFKLAGKRGANKEGEKGALMDAKVIRIKREEDTIERSPTSAKCQNRPNIASSLPSRERCPYKNLDSTRVFISKMERKVEAATEYKKKTARSMRDHKFIYSRSLVCCEGTRLSNENQRSPKDRCHLVIPYCLA